MHQKGILQHLILVFLLSYDPVRHRSVMSRADKYATFPKAKPKKGAKK